MAIIRRDQNRPVRIEISNPIFLARGCKELFELMNSAFNIRLYYQVAHMGHIAVELGMKAVYAKNYNGEHPWGHSLPEICVCDYSANRSLIDDINRNAIVHHHYLHIKMVWDMQNRYMWTRISRNEALLRKQAYTGVIKWLQSNYL